MLNDEIDNVEPFIEEYYPRIDKELYNKKEETVFELKKPDDNNYQSKAVEDKPKNKVHNIYNYQYPYYYNYPYNQYKRVTNRNRKKTKQIKLGKQGYFYFVFKWTNIKCYVIIVLNKSESPLAIISFK